MKITDGTGSGNGAGVNSENRLEVQAVTQTRVADVSERDGEGFIIASDFISLTTTGSFNGVLYLKNTNTKDVLIQRIRVCSDASGSAQVRLIRNPTAGTLISDANLADQLSSNAGSNKTFADFGLAYSASGDGKTVTDGSNWSNFINRSPGHSVQNYDGALILPRGSSMAVTVKPSASTTLCVEVQLWMDKVEV